MLYWKASRFLKEKSKHQIKRCGKKCNLCTYLLFYSKEYIFPISMSSGAILSTKSLVLPAT